MNTRICRRRGSHTKNNEFSNPYETIIWCVGRGTICLSNAPSPMFATCSRLIGCRLTKVRMVSSRARIKRVVEAATCRAGGTSDNSSALVQRSVNATAPDTKSVMVIARLSARAPFATSTTESRAFAPVRSTRRLPRYHAAGVDDTGGWTDGRKMMHRLSHQIPRDTMYSLKTFGDHGAHELTTLHRFSSTSSLS